jgi:hypothetical protein
VPAVLAALNSAQSLSVPVLPTVRAYLSDSGVATCPRCPTFDEFGYQWNQTKYTPVGASVDTKPYLTKYLSN